MRDIVDGGEAIGVGTVIAGRFRLEEVVGGGGFGMVYRATQLSVDRQVALKLFHDDVARDPTTRRRIQREAKSLANIKSDHLVSFLDFGQTASGRFFIATELLGGRELAEIIEQEGAMSPRRVARLGMQICDALVGCHNAGFVHRDIKPENVKVDTRHSTGEHATVFDLGIAKPTGSESGGSGLTQTGMIIGSPAYMSPEQCNSQAVGPASDIYSLGVMLFELATGHVPFDGETNVDFMHAHVNNPPPKLELGDSAAGRALSEVITRCLSKAPVGRPGSAGDLGAILGSIASLPRDNDEPVVFGAASSGASQRNRSETAFEATPTGWQGGQSGAWYLESIVGTLPAAPKSTPATRSRRPTRTRQGLMVGGGVAAGWLLSALIGGTSTVETRHVPSAPKVIERVVVLEEDEPKQAASASDVTLFYGPIDDSAVVDPDLAAAWEAAEARQRRLARRRARLRREKAEAKKAAEKKAAAKKAAKKKASTKTKTKRRRKSGKSTAP